MRLDPNVVRNHARRLEQARILETRDRLIAAILRDERQLDEHDGYPHVASGADTSGGGSSELTSVESAAMARVRQSKHRDHLVQAYAAWDRMVEDYDTVLSQLRFAEQTVEPVVTQQVPRCFCCWRHSIDMPADHFCTVKGNLPRDEHVCHSCYVQILRTGEPCTRSVHQSRQEAQAS